MKTYNEWELWLKNGIKEILHVEEYQCPNLEEIYKKLQGDCACVSTLNYNYPDSILGSICFLGDIELIKKVLALKLSEDDMLRISFFIGASGNLDAIQYLFNNAAATGNWSNFNEQDMWGYAFIHFIGMSGQTEAIRYVLENNNGLIDFNVHTAINGMRFVDYVVESGNILGIKCLFENAPQCHITLNVRNDGAWPFIYSVGKSGNLEAILWVLQNGGNYGITFNLAEEDGQLLSDAIAKSRNLEVIKWLCENGNDLGIRFNPEDFLCRVIPHYCHYENKHIMAIFQFLFEKYKENGIDIKLNKSTEYQPAPIQWIGKTGDLELIKWLFDNSKIYSINLNQQDYIGKTILHYIVESKNHEMIQWLLKNGKNYPINFNIPDSYGVTVAHYIAEYGNKEDIQCLFESANGLVDLNLVGDSKRTVAQYISRNNDPDTLQLLFENAEKYHMDLNAGSDDSFSTVAYYIVSHHNAEAVRCLLNNADICEINLNDNSFVDYSSLTKLSNLRADYPFVDIYFKFKSYIQGDEVSHDIEYKDEDLIDKCFGELPAYFFFSAAKFFEQYKQYLSEDFHGEIPERIRKTYIKLYNFMAETLQKYSYSELRQKKIPAEYICYVVKSVRAVDVLSVATNKQETDAVINRFYNFISNFAEAVNDVQLVIKLLWSCANEVLLSNKTVDQDFDGYVALLEIYLNKAREMEKEKTRKAMAIEAKTDRCCMSLDVAEEKSVGSNNLSLKPTLVEVKSVDHASCDQQLLAASVVNPAVVPTEEFDELLLMQAPETEKNIGLWGIQHKIEVGKNYGLKGSKWQLALFMSGGIYQLSTKCCLCLEHLIIELDYCCRKETEKSRLQFMQKAKEILSTACNSINNNNDAQQIFKYLEKCKIQLSWLNNGCQDLYTQIVTKLTSLSAQVDINVQLDKLLFVIDAVLAIDSSKAICRMKDTLEVALNRISSTNNINKIGLHLAECKQTMDKLIKDEKLAASINGDAKLKALYNDTALTLNKLSAQSNNAEMDGAPNFGAMS